MKNYIKLGALVLTSSWFLYAGDQTIYQYKIYCITEGKNVITWAETTPTTCPNNTAHTINPSSISIIDERGPDSLKIKEESIPTGGHFRAEALTMNIAAGPDVITTITKSWPYPINIFAVYMITGAEHEGDILEVYTP